MHQKARFCIKSIQKHFRGSQRPDPRGRRRDICSHPPTKCWCPSASYRLATALVTGQRFRPGSYLGLGEHCGLLGRYGVDPRPPKGFPLFSALRMAFPDTIILLMLDHHAAIGAKAPWPLDRAMPAEIIREDFYGVQEQFWLDAHPDATNDHYL